MNPEGLQKPVRFLNSIYLIWFPRTVLDVHVLGVGKDQYNEYLDQMVDGRILPLTRFTE
jgi:hypothetical protein